MSKTITAAELRDWLYDGAELALLDVREPGQQILGHILFSAPLPWSRFETALPRLAPNPAVRMVLCDDGDGIAAQAAAATRTMGYTAVHVLEGGVASWAEAGHTLYQGVNVPSKAFGELVEHVCDTPRLAASEIAQLQTDGADMVIVDGRPLAEFRKMSIPGAGCCPNGELALRAASFAPDPETTIVVNCAGRTRSIIGAQTLIDMGVPNRVVAMENGTQGWVLAGLSLDRGRDGTLPGVPGDIAGERGRAEALAAQHGVEMVSTAAVAEWLTAGETSVYLLDVRTDAERASDPADLRAWMAACGVVHAPGGQLVQATDQWIGVRNARPVLLDSDGVRARVSAAWLRRLGHAACVLEGGVEALAGLDAPTRITPPSLPVPTPLAPEDLGQHLADGATLIDLRSSSAYRSGHPAGAVWGIRPRIAVDVRREVVLISDDPDIAALVMQDLTTAGIPQVWHLNGGPEAWSEAGIEMAATPSLPADADRIDFQSFTAGRHDGNEAASRQYLAWELALVDQLDPQERAVFRI